MLYTVIFTITGIITVKKGNLNIGSQKSGFSVRVNAPPKTTVPFAVLPENGSVLFQGWFKQYRLLVYANSSFQGRRIHR